MFFPICHTMKGALQRTQCSSQHQHGSSTVFNSTSRGYDALFWLPGHQAYMYTYMYTVQYTHTYICTYVMGKTLIHISNKQAMRTVNSDRGKEATAERMSEQKQRETDKARRVSIRLLGAFFPRSWSSPCSQRAKPNKLWPLLLGCGTHMVCMNCSSLSRQWPISSSL